MKPAPQLYTSYYESALFRFWNFDFQLSFSSVLIFRARCSVID
jgi:hypothetical protein